MEAKDLMIGDWVYDIILKGNTRVEILSPSGIKGDFHENVWHENDFEPIPLTPEILEQNGFIVKRPESAKRTYWRDRAGQIVGHKNRGLMYMEIDGNPVKFGYFLPHFSGHVQFVHELQHALRLCGIDREIIL